jgi:hypothetical protein
VLVRDQGSSPLFEDDMLDAMVREQDAGVDRVVQVSDEVDPRPESLLQQGISAA